MRVVSRCAAAAAILTASTVRVLMAMRMSVTMAMRVVSRCAAAAAILTASTVRVLMAMRMSVTMAMPVPSAAANLCAMAMVTAPTLELIPRCLSKADDGHAIKGNDQHCPDICDD